MRWVTLEDVILFHEKIIEKIGGLSGIRDIRLIESAINKAFVTFEGKDLYKNLEDKIATTTIALIRNHGFVDGNKRSC